MANFDQRELRDVLGAFVTGVTVITTVDEHGTPRGVTVNSFSSVSLDPPLVLWSQALTATSYPVFRDAKRFVVNILAEDQVDISKRFASSIENRFEGTEFHVGLGGVPVLDGCAAFLECRSFATYPGGDHAVFLGEVENFQRASRKPLAFGGGRYMVAYAHESGAATAEANAESLVQLKALRIASAVLPELRAKVAMNLLVSVWGNRGPTVVHWEPLTGNIHENMRVGLVMSTLDSANGQLFAAFLPRSDTQGIVDEERSAAQAAGLPAPKQDEIEARLVETRQRGMVLRSPPYYMYTGDPHRATLSAPVFDQSGKIILALSATGSVPATGAGWDSPMVMAVADAAASISRQLGYTGVSAS